MMCCKNVPKCWLTFYKGRLPHKTTTRQPFTSSTDRAILSLECWYFKLVSLIPFSNSLPIEETYRRTSLGCSCNRKENCFVSVSSSHLIFLFYFSCYKSQEKSLCIYFEITLPFSAGATENHFKTVLVLWAGKGFENNCDLLFFAQMWCMPP